MKDLIERQAAIDALRGCEFDYYMEFGQYLGEDVKKVHLIRAEKAQDALEKLPSIQPERKKGKWSFIGYNMFECTCCGTPYTTQQLNGLRNYNTDPYAPKYCPNCGADMRVENDD